MANNGTLVFNRSNSYTFGGLVSGTGGVTQLGSGTTILTADNTYTGGTTISAGTLQLGAGGATGGIVGNVVNNGGLVFNRGNGYAFGGVISGTGSVTQQGAGTTVLSGNNSYTGATTVSAGGLYVNGDQTAATGATTVNNATLGGKGVIGGDVTLTGTRCRPATTAPRRHADDQGQSGAGQRHGAELLVRPGQCGRRPLNDLTNVGGNVALGGKLNVALSPGGRFDVGIYRIINYGGTLSNPAGLTLGTLPAGANAADYFIQTSVDKQVNLAYTNGLTLNYWDGDAGPKNNNQVNGGAGTWVAPGGVNDNGPMRRFGQCALEPGRLRRLHRPERHGAGRQHDQRTDQRAGHAVRHRWLCAARQCRRRQADPDRHAHGRRRSQRGRHPGGRGLGRWRRLYGHHLGRARRRGQAGQDRPGHAGAVGDQYYTGGTAVNGGTLQVSQDSNMGALAGALSLNGGTLATTATFDTARATTLRAAAASTSRRAPTSASPAPSAAAAH